MLRKSGLRKLSWLRRERSGQGESGAIECEPGLFEGRLSVWAPAVVSSRWISLSREASVSASSKEPAPVSLIVGDC
jgi:hypothetical protein